MNRPSNKDLAKIDFDLLSKFDTVGPRYTSYPTAPQFLKEFTSHDLLQEISQTNAQPQPPPLSLYFHLPFCESVCFFCGCNVTFTSDRTRPKAYTQLLIQEMEQISKKIALNREVQQLHWGGGTPTFFQPDQLQALHEATQKRFIFSKNAELGLEVDPRETTVHHLKVLGHLGFNRLSMGVQDFNPKVQEAVHRIQSVEITRQTLEEARNQGFQSLSIDLIYGLPFQTEKSFAKTLEIIFKLQPDRVAVFNFAYLPEMIRHQKAIHPETLPTPQEKIAILRRCIQMFSDAGYRHIGMDHFAKPEDELCLAQDQGTLYRNFQGYTTHAGCDLYAFGVSAISQIGKIYSQNHKNIHHYQSAIEKGSLPIAHGIRLQPDDLLRREIIMQLLCKFTLNPQEIAQKYNINFQSYFSEALNALKPFEEANLIEFNNSKMIVSSTGKLLIRNICMCFDAYLKKNPQQKFSRTV